MIVSLLFFSCSNDKTVNINNASPEATIVSHNPGDTVVEGTTVDFVAALTDPNHDTDDLIAAWYANGEEQCDFLSPNEQGDSICSILINPDLTEVRVEVRDPKNAVGQSILDVVVTTTEPPVAQIIRPESEGVYTEGVPITFEAIATDEEDSSSALTLTWSSDQDGVLDVTGSIESTGFYEGSGTLLEGEHTITLLVEDTNGKTAEDSVDVVVGPTNQSPEGVSIDIQNAQGSSMTEATDGASLVCVASFSDPEDDDLTVVYEWTGPQQSILNTDTSINTFTVDYTTQGLQPSDELMCTATASDDYGSVSLSDTVTLLDCSPFAEEIPYDGIDSNCDGLESLSVTNNTPNEDYDDDDYDNFTTTPNGNTSPDIQPRIGVECYGNRYNLVGEDFYMLYCDADLYWKNAQDFCVDNGYDGLISVRSQEEMDVLSQLGSSLRGDGMYVSSDPSVTWSQPWVGLTRGPDCSPVTNTSTGFPSVCTSNRTNYYWIDGTSNAWYPSMSAVWLDSELSANNSVEHCAYIELSEPGFYDIYCDYVPSSPHNTWSQTHTQAPVCVKRIP